MLSRFLRAAPWGVIALALSTASLADYHVDILPPVTPVSSDIYQLHWGILWVCVVIFFIVFGAMFWSIFKHRRSLGAKAAKPGRKSRACRRVKKRATRRPSGVTS